MFRAFGPCKALPLAVPEMHWDVLGLAGSGRVLCVHGRRMLGGPRGEQCSVVLKKDL